MKTFLKLALAACLAVSPVATAIPVMAATAKITPFYKNGKTDYTLKMHAIMSSLAAGDYDAAWSQQNALDRFMSKGDRKAYLDALYPLYDLAQAMIEARPAGTGRKVTAARNPWTAMSTVRNIYVTKTGIDKANAFLASDDIGLSVDMIRSMVVKQLVADAKRAGTREAYGRLLDVLDPSDQGYTEAKNHLAQYDYDKMCTSAAGCREFLRDYPESPLVAKAKERAMHYDFDEAKQAGTAERWHKFIADYEYVPEAKPYLDTARDNLKRLEDSQLVSKSVTLAQLDAYVSSNRRDLGNSVFTVYDNLINLPTHSYRFMSLKLGFGGVTGRVEETVTDLGGSKFVNRYTFNKQGLLEEMVDGRTKATTRYTYGYDAARGFFPLTKVTGGKTYRYTCSYDAANGHLTRVRCTDGSSMSYSYDAGGRLTGRVEVTAAGKRHVATYRSGKIRTEQTGDVTLKFEKYDGAYPTQILSQNKGKNYTWTYVYSLDSAGRWTRADARLDGKPRLTITRAYSE